MKIAALSAALLGGVATIASLSPASARESWSFHVDHVLGTSLDIIAVAEEESIAALSAAAAQSEINRLDPILSGWREDSELQALNSSAAMTASPDLYNVIAATEKWRVATGGCFSARLGRLEASVALPVADIGSMATAIAGAPVTLDDATLRINRPQAVRFAVDGLAKGYIIDRAVEAARRVPGIQGLMINIGGDLRCWGAAPTAGGWRIGVVDASNCADNAAPVAILNLADRAVATSGRGARGNTVLEPRSGMPATHVTMATAIAYHAADADALASAFAVMKPEDSIALADSMAGVSAHIVAADGKTYVSRDWGNLVIAQADMPKRSAEDAKPAAGEPWQAGFSLKIEYEIPNFSNESRSRNPYVTLWVTNEAGALVRTLTYLAGKRRFIDENYVFWDHFGAKQPDLVESVTRPTRPPGRYTLVWDGRDDKGRALPQGIYVLNVEASRQHGDHSIQRMKLNLGTSPFSTSAPAQKEIGTTSVVYGSNP